VARKEYDWEIGSQPPTIGVHSVVKHNIIRAYVARYVEILAGNPRQRALRLTVVDGFAGGGLYLREDNHQEHEGSPLLMLRACDEAEYQSRQRRRNDFNLLSDFFFVEKKRSNFLYLEHVLKDRGFGDQIGHRIQLRLADINDEIPRITEFIHSKGRARRAIFLLDQYGYDQVPKSLIRSILSNLPNAEIIFTFNVDSLIAFLSDREQSQKLLAKIELGDALRDLSINQLKITDRSWRQVIQTRLYEDLVAGCGARHYTPFFIRPGRGFGNYWLIHLSMHPRARSAMVDLHWESNNNFIHFGGAGLNMLGYTPKLDSELTGQIALDYMFDSNASERSKHALLSDLSTYVGRAPAGITFEELFAQTCNTTPASNAMYRDALASLAAMRVLEIRGDDGAQRREAGAIKNTDRLLIPSQRYFTYK
jgi:three-Cys-motif partner protein